MAKVKALLAILLCLMVISSSTLTVMGSISSADVRETVASLNLSNVAVLDAQTTLLSTSGLNALFVDGSWFSIQEQNSNLLRDVKEIFSAGIPIVLVGGDVNLLCDVTNARLRRNSTLASEVQGAYFDGIKNCYLLAGGTGMASAIEEAYNWCIKKSRTGSSQAPSPLAIPQEVTVTAADPAPYWFNIEEWEMINATEPYGILDVVEQWFKLQYDKSSTYDWYTLTMSTTSSPGTVAYNSLWHNSNFDNIALVKVGDSRVTVITHGPTTTSGSSTASVNIGVSAGKEGATVDVGYSYSYSISDVTVEDESVPSDGTVWWSHIVNKPDKEVGQYTLAFNPGPGFTIRTPPTGNSVVEQYGVLCYEAYWAQYVAPNWFWQWIWPDYSPVLRMDTWVFLCYNSAPDTPDPPTGGPGPGIQGVKDISYSFSTSATDPNGNDVGYWFDWGDGTAPTFSGWVPQGDTGSASHAWSHGGVYAVTARAEESLTHLQSGPSMIYPVTIQPTLTISASSGGANPPTSPRPGTHTYSYGSEATVTAYPRSGYYFDYWSLDGQVYSISTTTSVTMAADHLLEAHFSPNPTLRINSGTGGTTTPSAGTYTFNYGTDTSVRANPSAGYSFSYWYLDGSRDYRNPIPVHMTSNHVLTPYFAQESGGGGCPYVYVWNGADFVQDNNILPASENGNGTDTKDYYLLQQPLVPTRTTKLKSVYSVQIGEFEDNVDYLDQVRIIAVDHSQGTSVAVTGKGEIITYSDLTLPISCIDNNGTSRLSEISTMDGDVSDPRTYFQGDKDNLLILNFGPITSPYANVILRDDQKCADVCIDLQVPDEMGGWRTVQVLNPRDFWSIEAVNMTAYLPKTGDFIIRLLWTQTHRLDYVGLDTSAPVRPTLSSASPTLALHSTLGVVTAKLLSDDEKCVKLLNGQQVTLTFILPNVAQDTTRDFILYTNGYYYTITP